MKSNRLAFQIDFAEEEEKSEIISLQSTDGSLRFEDRYETFETLGQGAHAVVKIAKRKDTKQMFAVKIVRSSDPEVQINVKRTFINTKCLRHPNICQDIELFINEKMETSYLVMEYCPFPSLESVLKKRKLTEDEIRVIAKQLLQAIHHAHIKGICHRDLKPDNILVDFEEVQTPTFEKPSTLKVVDFGVSRRYQTKGVIQEMVTKTGNIFYCAPEIYTKSQYTQEVDLWAIGVILFQCATQRLPLHCNDEMEFIELLGKPDKWNFQEYLRDAPLPLQNLITQLLEYNPKERICAADALEHPFFRLQSLQDILALVSSQVDLNTVKQANCGRCKSVQMSLQMSHKWDKVVKTIHTTNQSEQVEVALDDLIRDLGNIHTIQRHGDKCNGMIQLMNSLNNSNMIISRIGSKQEILCISMGMGSIDSLSNISINQEKNVSNHTGGDPFSDFGNIQCSQEFATVKMPEKQHQQQNQNGFLQQQLNAKLDSSIDVQQEANNPHQRSNNIITMFEHLGIKEVDELVEDG